MSEFWIRVKTEEQLEAALEADFADNIILEAGDKNPADQSDNNINKKKKKIYMSLPDIAREAELAKIYAILNEERGKFDGICVKNIDELGILKECSYSKKIIADEFLYAYNSAAIDFYKSVFEDIDFIAPAELTMKELEKTEKSAGVNFIYKIYGHQKLMTTAQCFSGAYLNCKEKELRLRDEAGAFFTAASECEHCHDNIYNGIPTYMLDKLSEFGENLRFLLDFTTENRKETAEILALVKQPACGGKCRTPEKFTRGHYYAGVE